MRQTIPHGHVHYGTLGAWWIWNHIVPAQPETNATDRLLNGNFNALSYAANYIRLKRKLEVCVWVCLCFVFFVSFFIPFNPVTVVWQRLRFGEMITIAHWHIVLRWFIRQHPANRNQPPCAVYRLDAHLVREGVGFFLPTWNDTSIKMQWYSESEKQQHNTKKCYHST